MKPTFKPYEGTEDYIFVSYSHKDDEKVYSLIQQLHDKGYRIWYDEGLYGGTYWNEIIETHLERTSLVLAFMSPNAVESEYVRDEITYAKDNKKPMIPIFLCETKLHYGLKLQLGSRQWENYYNYSNDNAFFDKLLLSPLFTSTINLTNEGVQSEVKVSIISVTDTSVTAQASGSSGTGTYAFGKSTSNDWHFIQDWYYGSSTGTFTFQNLNPSTTYYVFAYKDKDNNYIMSSVSSSAHDTTLPENNK
ncbi:MAG: toll/interleukin-1 receptor domain-containing protein [Oscillospiraceae bacterium]|nr:toll/interleukin-1 receptor domain-containing protein [Oscillospiraceae bacterium]